MNMERVLVLAMTIVGALAIASCSGPVTFSEAEEAASSIEDVKSEISDVQSELRSAANGENGLEESDLEQLASQLGSAISMLDEVQSTVEPPEPPESGTGAPPEPAGGAGAPAGGGLQ